MSDDWRQVLAARWTDDVDRAASEQGGAPPQSSPGSNLSRPIVTGAVAAATLAMLLLVGLPFYVPPVETSVLKLAEAMTWDLIKTPSTARIVPSIVYRSARGDYFVCVVELDAQNGFGAILRSYLAFIVRSDVPKPMNEGYRTPDRVRDQCNTGSGTLWIQCVER